MKKPINRVKAILLFVDVAAYKGSTIKNRGYSGRTLFPTVAFFWANIVYRPARWFGADHQVLIYILFALAIFKLFLNLAYFNDMGDIAENYSSHYYYFLYIFFNAICIGFGLWDFDYMIGK